MQARTGLFCSLFLHLSVVLLTVFWFGNGAMKSLDKPYMVDLVSFAPAGGGGGGGQKAPAAKVEAKDIKALPEQALPEPPKPVAKPEPAARPEPTAISEKKVETKKQAKDKQADALASALDAVKQDVSKRERKGQRAVASELDALRKSAGDIYAEGEGEGGAGGAGSGTGSGLLAVYGSIVEKAIKKNWRFPVVGRDKNLVVVVEIRISKAGQILEAKVAQPSGRPDFDNSAIKAVTETKELPPPPSDKIEALRINFNLQDLKQ